MARRGSSSRGEIRQRPIGSRGGLMSADSALMDFIEQSVEILTCIDAGNDVSAMEAAQGLLTNSASTKTPKKDYATMHDEFLESLLQEQVQAFDLRSQTSSPPPLMESSSDSVSTGTSYDTSEPPSKKRRGMKLHRRPVASPSRHKRQLHVMDSSLTVDDDDSYAPKRLFLEELTAKRPAPHTYVHTACQMQKDKGKGELVGTDVCANGRNECLEKLRQKMELLAQVALGGHVKPNGKKSKGGADMKRRKARVMQVTNAFTETRSVIHLRMGFLAMQYGVLLRWDRRTHKIHFVVLRKMCSESFYSKTLSNQSSEPEQIPTPEETEPAGYVIKSVVNGNHAILQRGDGCEVALLDPPYLVQRPAKFVPSVFQVKVLHVEGLNPKSTWTVKVMFENATKAVRLGWNQKTSTFAPRSNDSAALEWVVPQSSVDLHVEVMLFEQKRPSHRRKRLHTTLPVPLTFLEATPSTSKTRSRRVMIPVDDSSSITLSIHHQSDYVHWLQKEVEARKREVHGFMWTAPFYKPPPVECEAQEETAVMKTFLNPFELCCAW